MLGALLLAMVSANLMLANGFSESFDDVDRVNVSFGRAWIFWPTTVHVRDLRVVFRDEHVQGSIELPRAVIELRLTDLLSRTLHATRVEGEGLRFRLRHRVERRSAGKTWVDSLPPIQEFTDPPLLGGALPPSSADSEYKLWTVHLENVNVRTEEIWVQFVRYRGVALARGAFRLSPMRQLWVGPSSLQIERGQLTLVNQPLPQRVRGVLRAEVQPFDVRVPVGRQVLQYLSGQVDLSLDGARVKRALFEPTDSPFEQVSVMPAAVRVVARIDRGRLADWSRIEVTTTHASILVPHLSPAWSMSV